MPREFIPSPEFPQTVGPGKFGEHFLRCSKHSWNFLALGYVTMFVWRKNVQHNMMLARLRANNVRWCRRGCISRMPRGYFLQATDRKVVSK